MKKTNLSYACFFCIVTLCCLLACKKSNIYTSPPPDTLSFNYLGNHYDFTPGQWSFSKVMGLIFYRFPTSAATLYFPSGNCAYVNTDSLNYFSLNYSNCVLFAGLPVDSAKLYLYQAGAQNITTKNCQNTTRFNIITFTSDPVTVCDIDGFFNLTLKNSQDKTIVITDGEFHKFAAVY